MAAGKLALLLLVGGLAGAAFAGMTTGVMRPYREQAAPTGMSYSAPPARQSWLDEGLSLLDSPAWPFGQGAHPDAEPALYPDTQDYAPDGYGRSDGHDMDRWERDEQRGYRNDGAYDDGQSDDDYRAETPALRADRDDGAGMAPHLPRQGDAATDAARRAATAAQDVIAAEQAN